MFTVQKKLWFPHPLNKILVIIMITAGPVRNPNDAMSCSTPVANELIPTPKAESAPPRNIQVPQSNLPIIKLARGPEIIANDINKVIIRLYLWFRKSQSRNQLPVWLK